MSRNDDLWALLTDEELALQSDEWRYAAREHRLRRRFGLERYALRMSDDALTYLNARLEARRQALALGEQLQFTEREYRRVFEPGA